jgi:hypothetical protein
VNDWHGMDIGDLTRLGISELVKSLEWSVYCSSES